MSDLHGQVKPAESLEPPIMPQKVKRPDPTIAYSEAKLYQKLFVKMKDTFVHLMYLGKYAFALIY